MKTALSDGGSAIAVGTVAPVPYLFLSISDRNERQFLPLGLIEIGTSIACGKGTDKKIIVEKWNSGKRSYDKVTEISTLEFDGDVESIDFRVSNKIAISFRLSYNKNQVVLVAQCIKPTGFKHAKN